MKGGSIMAKNNFPPEKNIASMKCYHLPNEKLIRSLCFDMPYIYTLDDDGIEAYRIQTMTTPPQFLGRYKLFSSCFEYITQIVCIRRHVYWNGQNKLHSLEVIDD